MVAGDAAVDDQVVPVDVARLGAEQEGDHVGDVVRLGDAPERIAEWMAAFRAGSAGPVQLNIWIPDGGEPARLDAVRAFLGRFGEPGDPPGPAPVFAEQSTPFGVFHAIRLADHGIVGDAGRPGLPVRGVGLALPEGTTPRLSYDILSTRDYPGVRPLPMAEGPVAEGASLLREGDMAFDPAGYEGVSVAGEPIVLEELGRLRHHRVGQVGRLRGTGQHAVDAGDTAVGR